MIKHFDTFAGAGGFSLALQEAIGEVKTIGFSEIDKFAIQTYQKNFPGVPNFGDISKIDIKNLPDFDLLTGGFPCQDVSVAGKQSLEGGRTILVEYLLQILEEKQPKYFVFENVKGLMSKKFDIFRNSIFDRIHKAGYSYDCAILNTRDFGLPQNRERVFIVGSLGKLDFQFPEKQELKVFLRDILEDEVEEKYYLSGETFEKLKKFESNTRLYEDIVPTLNTMQGGHRQPKVIITHSLYPRSSKNGRGGTGHLTKKDNTSYCLDTGNMQAVELQNRIRKLTPTECERLQGFPDGWTDGVSNSQRYKQMGNAISIPPVRDIFRNLL